MGDLCSKMSCCEQVMTGDTIAKPAIRQRLSADDVRGDLAGGDSRQVLRQARNVQEYHRLFPLKYTHLVNFVD